MLLVMILIHFLWIPVSATAVNLNGTSTLFVNSVSGFIIHVRPSLINSKKFLPMNTHNCIVLNTWVFDNFINFNEQFSKTFLRLMTCLLELNQLHLWLHTLIYPAADMMTIHRMCSFINQIIYMIFSLKARKEWIFQVKMNISCKNIKTVVLWTFMSFLEILENSQLNICYRVFSDVNWKFEQLYLKVGSETSDFLWTLQFFGEEPLQDTDFLLKIGRKL